MMKEEFEKRIGLVISCEEYEVIEAAYMGMPESVDKDKFVKIWLKEGGIQDLFDKRALLARSRGEEIKRLTKERDERVDDMNANAKEIIRLRQTIKGLEEKLAAINAMTQEAAA